MNYLNVLNAYNGPSRSITMENHIFPAEYFMLGMAGLLGLMVFLS